MAGPNSAALTDCSPMLSNVLPIAARVFLIVENSSGTVATSDSAATGFAVSGGDGGLGVVDISVVTTRLGFWDDVVEELELGGLTDDIFNQLVDL